ncbi:MAG: 3-oxoacyl-[acyl-carrier-protein] synthase III C-terminal domain-containing protein, partial [Planctomycetota bacterium]
KQKRTFTPADGEKWLADTFCCQLVPHQASPHAVEAIRRVLGFSVENYHVGIQGLGNLASASIPVMLDRLRKSDRLNPGQDILLLGTSAGYSQAALCFQL